MPHRDDIEILARTTDLLLERREPAELARRFLEHVAAVYGADVGIVALRQGDDLPGMCLLGIEPPAASRLAAELAGALARERSPCSVWRPWRAVDGGAGWPGALAAALKVGRGPPGLVALLTRRPDGFNPAPNTRLLRILVRHAAMALEHAVLHREAMRQAERLAIQAEELEQVHQALEHHSREVERSLAARSRFFASMSHELRTPINAIVGYVDLLRQGVLGSLNRRQHEAVDKVASSAAQLLTLVNDSLDLSKIEAGKMSIRPTPVDLPGLIADAAAAVEVMARMKGLELRIAFDGPLPAIETDGARVRQVLLNLLSNAVKFTPSGSITVVVRHIRVPEHVRHPARPAAEPGPDGWVAVTVEDTGPGIAPEEIETIFGEFVQLPQQSGETNGSGLGLSISNRIARLLGGELMVESVVGVRSAFTLFLPCPAPTLPAAASSDA